MLYTAYLLRPLFFLRQDRACAEIVFPVSVLSQRWPLSNLSSQVTGTEELIDIQCPVVGIIRVAIVLVVRDNGQIETGSES